MYHVEIFTISDSDENTLDMLEKIFPRIIYGPVCLDGEKTVRWNYDLYSFYKDAQF